MPADLFILRGPPGSGKTKFLIDRFVESSQGRPGQCLWLTPTDRHRAELRRRFDEDFKPNIVTFPELANGIVQPEQNGVTTASEMHQRLILDRVLSELSAKRKLGFFNSIATTLGFAQSAFAFISEMKGRGITHEALAETAQAIDPEKLPPPLADAITIFREFQNQLGKSGHADRAAIYQLAIDQMDESRFGRFGAVRAIFADGFTDFTPPQYELLTRWANVCDQLWITLTLDPPDDNSRSELFRRPLDTLAKIQRLPVKSAHVTNVTAKSESPIGIGHLQSGLFRESAPQSSDAAGLHLIKAPGLRGELRLVARAVKQLLNNGEAADEIVIATRDLNADADIIRDVFADYDIPVEIDGTEPLGRSPAIAVVLRAARLAADDFPFAATTALLRNHAFQPNWTPDRPIADVGLKADQLLRHLDVPASRDQFLRVIRQWAIEPRQPLEDEEAQESHHKSVHKAAKEMLPFFEWFFVRWDSQPNRGTLIEHLNWIQTFCEETGLDELNPLLLERFFAEVQTMADRETGNWPMPDALSLFDTIAGAIGIPRSEAGPGQVRILPVDLARGLSPEHLFVVGLKESSFPRLGAGSLIDDSVRQRLKEHGLDVAVAAERRPDEMLLYFDLLSRPRKSLTLSYPAVDEKGQELFPATFLSNTMDLFSTVGIPSTSQTMPTDGFLSDKPLSISEQRVCWAAQRIAADQPSKLDDKTVSTIRKAEAMENSRFKDKKFNQFDGLLGDEKLINDLQKQFGPAKPFSPTALERYVGCPFQFFARDVLGLEPLAFPVEDMDTGLRGSAFHRALSRAHRLFTPGRKLDEFGAMLTTFLDDAITEYVDRTSSQVARVLWKLESKRLARSTARYPSQWGKFTAPWGKEGVQPEPGYFEAEFGFKSNGPPTLDLEQVRIRGRIDRIDVATLADGTTGFWVIDYKSGGSSVYTAPSVQDMSRLQLPIYAMAVERLIVQQGRPMGLIYWFIADDGPKSVLPADKKFGATWHDNAKPWQEFRQKVEQVVLQSVKKIRLAEFPVQPRTEDTCNNCPYHSVCRISQSRHVDKTWSRPTDVLPNG